MVTRHPTSRNGGKVCGWEWQGEGERWIGVEKQPVIPLAVPSHNCLCFFLHVTTYRVSIPQLTGLLYQMGMLSYYPTSIPYILYLYGDNPSSWGPWLLRSKVHKAHPPSLPQCLGCSLRFGKAMSRLRTRFQGEVRKKARDTLKHNLKNYKCIPQNKRASAAWIKYAELDSVFDYLA